MFLLPRAQVQSLDGELRSYKTQVQQKKGEWGQNHQITSTFLNSFKLISSLSCISNHLTFQTNKLSKIQRLKVAKLEPQTIQFPCQYALPVQLTEAFILIRKGEGVVGMIYFMINLLFKRVLFL